MEVARLCRNHTEKIVRNEFVALKAWGQMMRLGTSAFSSCRLDDARKYLSTAVEISLLRALCCGNAQFFLKHILEPLELLVEACIQDCSFNEASESLNKALDVINRSDLDAEGELECKKLCMRLEREEKRYLQVGSFLYEPAIKSGISFSEVR